MLRTFIKVLDKVCPTFIHFSWHEWKLTKYSWYLKNFPSLFNNIYLKSFGLLQNITKMWDFMKVKEWHFMKLMKFIVIILCFHSVQCTFLTFAVTFGALKSWLQNFSLFWTDSKFRNFRLGQWWKSKKSISQLPKWSMTHMTHSWKKLPQKYEWRTLRCSSIRISK